VLHTPLPTPRPSPPPSTHPSAFFFDWGVVCFWGIGTADEQALMHTVVRPCCVSSLDVSEVEIDSFSYNYSAVEPPHVQVGCGGGGGWVRGAGPV